jgi:hypothetical protein
LRLVVHQMRNLRRSLCGRLISAVRFVSHKRAGVTCKSCKKAMKGE